MTKTQREILKMAAIAYLIVSVAFGIFIQMITPDLGRLSLVLGPTWPIWIGQYVMGGL